MLNLLQMEYYHISVSTMDFKIHHALLA